MAGFLKKYWFFVGLILVFTITLADGSDIISGAGKWVKAHKGPEVGIVLIFFFSGLVIHARQIKTGIMDMKGLLASLTGIFIAAPIIAAAFSLLPMQHGLIIGIFIVSVMPSTISSGVVMTGSAGGNIAHALLITILANIISVFSIPVVLSWLLRLIANEGYTSIDKQSIMMKIGCLVVLPLCMGVFSKHFLSGVVERLGNLIHSANQFLVIGIVWISLSQTKTVILKNMDTVPMVFLVVAGFHLILLASVFMLTTILKIKRGRRESVILMGAQKTLPLSVIIQVTLFPEYGVALVVCVLHHIVHLLIDGYLVGILSERPSDSD